MPSVELENWQVFLIVGAINDHWWYGSQDVYMGRTAFDPDECGPCSAVRDMTADIRREAVRRYEEITTSP